MNFMPIDAHGHLDGGGQVPSLELVRDLRWVNPRGQEIPQDDR